MKLLRKLTTLMPSSTPALWFTGFANACDKFITYTNGHIAVRIPNSTPLRGMYSKFQLKRHTGGDKAEEATLMKRYPQVDRIMPDEAKHTVKVTVNARFLANVLNVVSGEVQIHIDPKNPHAVILITNDEGSIGVVMPRNTEV